MTDDSRLQSYRWNVATPEPSVALELPLDAARAGRGVHRMDGVATPSRASCAIAAIAPDDATLVAAFAAQLARYSGQPAIPITATRLDAAGAVAWTAPLVLAIEGRTFGEIVAAATAELARPSAPVAHAGGDHAAVT